MLSKDDLKKWLHLRELTQADKLLLILATLTEPASVAEIGARGEEAGFRLPKNWNPSSVLERTRGKAIRTLRGWELTDAGRQHLRNLGVSKISPAAIQVAIDLRDQLSEIRDDDTRGFVEEAIKCYELEFYRSAVVMSWLAAMHVLHKYVHENHLADFNSEARRVDANWVPAKSTDDLGRMRERGFLDRIAAISVIGPNVKKELISCLDRRNACGHPNSLKIGANMVANHLESLLLNVFRVFA